MGIIDQVAQQEAQKQKAQAYDAMKHEQALSDAYNQGNNDSYNAGRRDGAAELNALMQGGLALQAANPEYAYEAQSGLPMAPIDQQYKALVEHYNPNNPGHMVASPKQDPRSALLDY